MTTFLLQLAQTPEVWWGIAAVCLLIPSPYARLIAPLFRWLGDKAKAPPSPK